MKKFLQLAMFLVAVLLSSTAMAQTGFIVFYEGNNGSQNIVDTKDDSPGQDFRPAQNDEARSVQLVAVRANCTIQVFDDPNGSLRDDFCIITTKRFIGSYIVNSFEQSYEDDNVRVTYIRNNGLDGKVSRIKIL
ncbi:hypothetical protein KTO58_07130 [Chitinophaga pendula]|uniref:hypothetical protein n=1 Tax=Chitinophaga TaxID=79328 RepID=UPI000BB075D6|nr:MULTISPECIES: hypothetical protein [Chitinophaga]ASZ13425.1 hypothetical protein CK934_21915 [Chitinophaga sp. MD30]UCJ08949.1 hypothetical protein KTO58_07130 [Chitinophaga pendula]